MNTGLVIRRLIMPLIVIFAVAVNLCYAQFTGGDGSEANPYQVSSADQMYNVRSYLGAHFIQTAEINLGVAPYNTGTGWLPIGSSLAPFTGSFNGNGFQILNLFIYRPSADYQALFGYSNMAELSKISLQNVSVQGRDYTAALIGCAYRTSLLQCRAQGSVYGSTNVGGLIGSLEVTGSLNESLANCNVTGQLNVGALVGYNKGSSTITACTAKGNVQGNNAVGGLIGTQGNSTVSQSYAFSAVTGTWGVGGLLGVNDTQSQVDHCYSIGHVTGTNSVGGLVGRSILSQTLFSYWNTQTSGKTSSAGGEGRLTSEMLYPYSGATYTGWDFANTWLSDGTLSVNSGYPYLLWQEQMLPPTDLVATAGIEQVYLSWQAPVGSNPLGFYIYRDNVLLNPQPLTVTEYTDSGLSGGVLYQYYVRSVYSAGESLASNTVEATPQASVTIPGAAVLIAPADGATDIDPQNLLLEWEAPVTGSSADGYMVYFSNSLPDLHTQFSTVVLNPATSFQPYPEYSLGYGEQWYWQVVPYNSAGSALLDACPVWSFYTFALLPPHLVTATDSVDTVQLNWFAPGDLNGNWLHYDSGYNSESIGTGGVADFDVAIRYPASVLTQYAGMYLSALQVFPADSGEFSLRVWTGGSASAPAMMVVDQPFTAQLNTYNEVALNTPVLITGTEELWFGYRCNVQSGYPAGCDEGPAVDGFGNMMYWQGAWSTLLSLNPDLDNNWNIQGLVSAARSNMGALEPLKPIAINSVRSSSGKISSNPNPLTNNRLNTVRTNLAPNGYRAWRLQIGEEQNEAAWSELSTEIIPDTTWQDSYWNSLTDGTYRWAVKAVYPGEMLSIPAFSNTLLKETLVPEISVTPGFIEYSITTSDTLQLQVVISNTGTAELSWNSEIINNRNGQSRFLNISLSPSNGILAPDSSQICSLSISPADTNLGMNYYELKISSNDLVNPVVTIPITIEVTSPLANIPDDNFRMAINEALGQAIDYQPTIADLNGMTGELIANDKMIISIEGAQYLISLHRLYLNNNQISDISPLAGLITLQEIQLYNNQITDLSPLAGLTSLQELYLANNPLSKESMLLTQSWSLPYVAYEYTAISPCYPSPERDAVDISLNDSLQWQGNYNSETVSYEVYLGTNPEELTLAGDAVALSDTLYSFSPTLNPLTEYYWRIKATASAADVWSGLWHFTTGDIPEFAGGSGSEEDPYLLATVENLNNIRNNLTSHFKQTADINLGVEPWTLNEGWIPIGASTSFQGTYDGDGHTITGLYINRPGEQYQGLFGFCSSATLKNLTLSNLNINGYNYAGGLAGSADNSSIVDNCSSSGSVTGNMYVGGLVGYLSNNSSVTNSYSTGTVTGVNIAGGLVGTTSTNCGINNSYSSSIVSCNNTAGGLVGTLRSSSSISNSYSSGSVTGNIAAGGLLGYIYSSTVTHSYWDTQSSGQSASEGGEGRTTVEMTYPYAANTFVDWDWANTWAGDIDNSVNSGYPYLQWYAPAPQYYPPQHVSAELIIDNVQLNWQAPLAGSPNVYQIWRLQPGMEADETSWTMVWGSVSDTSIEDPQWVSLDDGTYKWAVKASYGLDNFSLATFSNELIKYVFTPIISVTPVSIEHTMPANDTFQTEVVISNSGNAGLYWSGEVIADRSSQNDLIGQSLREADRQQNRLLTVTLSPSNGYVAPDSSLICILSVTPADTTSGNYNYNLFINSNDTVTPLTIIPISIQITAPLAYIPDDNFRMAINEHLGQTPDYQPTVADLNGITGMLNATNRNITNLQGAQYLTNLLYLYLESNQIIDLSYLAGLTNLNTLDLGGNQIINISPLSSLANLSWLNLSHNQINDITSLSGLAGLTNLLMVNNVISNIVPLEGLTSLTNLSLSGNQISNIYPLETLTNLNYLYLSGNLISGLNPLSGLTNLVNLDLSNNQISDLSPLAGLSNLVLLNLSANQANYLEPLEGLNNLNTLDLGFNQIGSLVPLAGLTNLSFLNVSANLFVDISPLVGLINLNYLYITGSQITDISPLAGMILLNVLLLDGSQISDLSPIAGFTNLIELSLEGNPLSKESMLLTQTWSLPYVASVYSAIAPCYPNPTRNAKTVPIETVLQWGGNYSAETVAYEVWMGLSANDLTQLGYGSAAPDTLFSFTPSLAYSTNYWWRIRAVTAADSVWSGLWQFTTAPLPYAPPRNINIVSMTPNVVLTWQAPLLGTPLSYQIWRLLPGQEGYDASWTLVSGMVADTIATDVQWQYLADGTYKWAVKAMYEGANFSAPAFSNELIKQSTFSDITVTPSTINHVMDENSYNQLMIEITNNGAAELNWNSFLEQVRNNASSPLLSSKTGSNNPTRDLTLDFSPSSGITPPLFNSTCYLTISTIGAEPGVYYYTLTIDSNDPDTPLLEIPIELTVQQVVNTAPVVSNVLAMQRDDASMMMDIYYDVYDANSDTLSISMQVSDDDGLTWNVSCNLIQTGSDIGSGIMSGTNLHIVWDVANEHPNVLGSNYRFKIIADDGVIPMPANFVLVESGTFNNGTSDVTLSSFYIDKYELTQADYQTVMGTNPASGYGEGSNYPVYYVSWFDAIEYCNRRSITEELTPCYSYSTYGTNTESWPVGWNTSDANHTNVNCNWTANGYRLPTEMEWQFAARGGNQTHNYTYSGSNDLNVVGWYWVNWGSANNSTHTVGGLAANELGIFDMSGNVLEWNWDIYGDYPGGSQTNPHGAASGWARVVRGGSWDLSADFCTVSFRNYGSATMTLVTLGFRCIRVSP